MGVGSLLREQRQSPTSASLPTIYSDCLSTFPPTILPHTYSPTHFHIPFPSTNAMSSRPSILQLQTQAANGARPIQNPLPKANRSDESISTVSSSGSSSPKSSLDIVRCSRCQRSLSIDTSLPANQSGAVRFGLNSYYCTRCANVVGFVK